MANKQQHTHTKKNSVLLKTCDTGSVQMAAIKKKMMYVQQVSFAVKSVSERN